MITNYIPNTCKYSVNNLKKVVHIFSESENVIHIDNGEAYASSGITDFQTIYATSVDFAESTSYDDRFKFEKQITVTVDGFLKLDSLNEKYYLVLEDENHTMWLVNADFPSFVTYTYTLSEGVDETVFTFNVLSNFPTLKLNASINNSYECKDYSLANVKELKMNLKENVTIDYKNHILYDSSNTPYYIVKFNEGSLKLEETYDGFNVTTTIQFNINFDDYKASWHYNLLEYQDNKYVAVTDHLAAGFEMGLIPSYNVQGSSQKGQGDIVTITLVGTSQRGSEWAEEWTEATLIPDYIWLLSNEWICDGDIPPVPPTGETKWIAYYSDSHTESAECDSTSAITSVEINKTNLVSVEIGNCVTTIDDTAFMYSSGLTSVTIGENVTTIGMGAFASCSGLTEVTIPSGITSIGAGAFSQCSGLTGVTVNTTTPPTLGGSAFEYTDCPIYVPCESLNTYKTASGWSAYADRLVCIPFEGKYKLTLNDSSIVSAECNSSSSITSSNTYSYRNSAVTAVIGDCVTSIGKGVFKRYSGLTSCTIGSNVRSIGLEAFDGCSGLTNIVIPDSVTDIGIRAFRNCTGLTSCTIGSGVTNIQGAAFCYCSGLTSIVIPDSVTSLGEAAFSHCSGLTSANIPDSVTSLGDGVFRACRSLTSCTIGSGITRIGNEAFDGCNSITSVGPVGSGASIEIPDNITSIDYASFADCASLTAVSLTNNLASINGTAFANNNIRYFYVDTDAATTNGMFKENTSIQTVVIGNNVTTIEENAFKSCTSLTSVTIGSGVTYIGGLAFYYCTSLTSVTILATQPPTLIDYPFVADSGCPIYVPSGSVDAYKTANTWSYYADRIQAIP